MANMNKEAHDHWYPLIKRKQGGEYCYNPECLATPFGLIQAGKSPQLLIDHIDNDNSHNELSNFQFLCRSCNYKKDEIFNRDILNVRDADPVFIKNLRTEKRFRNYVSGRLCNGETAIEHDGLVADGAEFCNCSPITIKRYLVKMTSPTEGNYIWEARQEGYAYLIPKPDE